jgi:nucleotide-binding universal stress UspA family protein
MAVRPRRREPDDVTDERSEMRSIVCGVDGSREAGAALHEAIRLSDRLGLRLVVVHVVAPARPAPTFGGAGMVSLGDELAAGERLVARLLERAGVADAERRVAYGYPAERLARIAEEEHADFVVVGSRGRGALRSALLGSVSVELCTTGGRPVVVVPAGPEATAEDSPRRSRRVHA